MINGLQQILVWVAFFIGVVVADQFVVEKRFYIVVLLSALVSTLLWRLGKTGWLVVSLAWLLFLGGVLRMEWVEQKLDDSQFHANVAEEVTITGLVVREPDVRETFTQLYVRLDNELLLVRTDRFTPVHYGDVVTVTGALAKPEPFLTDLNREFDYPSYLKARGVSYVVSFADVMVLESNQGNFLVKQLYTAKSKFAATVMSLLPPPQSDLGLGLLLGIKQALGEDLEQAFRRTGLIHIVVLSGYNVMLVIAFFWWVSSWVLPLRGRVVFGLIGITLFAILVGLSATVVRASIMAGILLLAKFFGTRYDVLRALLFAGFVMVLINPYVLLYDLGFQLSFMATLGLVLFLPQFESTVVTETRTVGLRDIFLATVVTQLFVLPLLVFHIGEISLVAVLVNLLVLPIVAVAMALTFATGLVGLVSQTVALPVALFTNLVLSYIIFVVTWFDQFAWASVTISVISVWEMIAMYVLLGVASLIYMQTKKRKDRAPALSSPTPIFFR